jgi:L-asparaginase/beta-aspartyl-peptidase (threonine type)
MRIVVHGGAGHPDKHRDGCVRAARIGLERLKAGEESLAAVLAAAVTMEDDGRFNAGRGGNLGLDGTTKQMDAGLMDTRGRLASVAAIETVKNPILVARALADTPLLMISGSGATRFARAAGFGEYYEVTDDARSNVEAAREALCKRRGGDFPPEWHTLDFAKFWNYTADIREVMPEYLRGTIGAVALDSDGHFAVATSTGGAGPMLFGRIGDTPLVCCGFYAGPAGAIAATGEGEYNIRTQIARTAYNFLVGGLSLQEALNRALDQIPGNIDTGLIGVSHSESAVAHNVQMPHAILEA